MVAARIEKVYADRVEARVFLRQAERFFADADCETLSAESRSVLLHNSVICACDAILQAVGSRVSGSDGAHMLRIEVALGHLLDDTEELLERLDASRVRRNEASYAAAAVPAASLADAREAAAELIALAGGFLA